MLSFYHCGAQFQSVLKELTSTVMEPELQNSPFQNDPTQEFGSSEFVELHCRNRRLICTKIQSDRNSAIVVAPNCGRLKPRQPF